MESNILSNEQVQLKYCSKCEQNLPVTNFYQDSLSNCYLSWCKECRLKNKSRNKERQKEYNKLYAKSGKQVSDEYRNKKLERRLLYVIETRAKQKQIDFNITVDDIIIPDICPYLGIKLNKEVKYDKGGERQDNSPSIDRFDYSKGYTKENIIVCSWRGNEIKKHAKLDEIKKVLYIKQQDDIDRYWFYQI